METKKITGILKRACIGVLLLLSSQLYAQQSGNEPVASPDQSFASDWEPGISPFFELLGKGWLSLNIDFRIKETYALSAGIAGIEEGWAPNVMGYYFGGKRHRLEMGGGTSVNFKDGAIFNLFIHGVIGYRYQKKKGLFFRTGFTPMFVIPLTDEGKNALIPWAGISLGYCF